MTDVEAWVPTSEEESNLTKEQKIGLSVGGAAAAVGLSSITIILLSIAVTIVAMCCCGFIIFYSIKRC